MNHNTARKTFINDVTQIQGGVPFSQLHYGSLLQHWFKTIWANQHISCLFKTKADIIMGLHVAPKRKRLPDSTLIFFTKLSKFSYLSARSKSNKIEKQFWYRITHLYQNRYQNGFSCLSRSVRTQKLIDDKRSILKAIHNKLFCSVLELSMKKLSSPVFPRYIKERGGNDFKGPSLIRKPFVLCI